MSTLLTPRVAAAASAAIGLGLAARMLAKRAAPSYVLHVYDHCPFCTRVEWLMQHYDSPYERVVHGYGAGSTPEKQGCTSVATRTLAFPPTFD